MTSPPLCDVVKQCSNRSACKPRERRVGTQGMSVTSVCARVTCFLVTRHPQDITHRSAFKKTNNPTVFNLHCKSDAILELCFSADSGEGHLLSHLRSFQQVWAVWGREVSSLFAVWFGSAPGYSLSRHGSTPGSDKPWCQSLGNLPLFCVSV